MGEDEDYDEEEVDDTDEVNERFSAITSNIFRPIERRILDWVIFIGVSAMILSVVALLAGAAAWLWKHVINM